MNDDTLSAIAEACAAASDSESPLAHRIMAIMARSPGGAPPVARDRFPQRGACAACGQPVLVAQSRTNPSLALMFDPEPDGDDEHYDTTLSDDLARVMGSGDATARDRIGRFPLYRAHPWSCPERLRRKDGGYGGYIPTVRPVAGR
jgi:hypothetical protein